MHAHDDRDQFAPPRPPARLRAIALAVLVHAVLIGALTWGLHWKSSADQPAMEAELWAAAPTAPTAPPAPSPVPAPPAAQSSPPPPERTTQPPDTRVADIAIEREKKRLAQEREQREQERKQEQRRERLEQEEEKERLQKEQRNKQLAEQEQKRAQDKRLAEEAAKRKAEINEKRLARQREDNLRRLQGLAGASGAENASGTALRNAGPSASYSARVSARVRPNIVYPDAIEGNPRAEVEVRLSPDGTIVGKRLAQSSGSKAWDEAVLRALDKTDTLPRDVDGRVPPSLVIEFRPRN